MTVITIIQARMGSSRLPGKMLLEIAKKPLLQHVIKRVQQATQVDKIILATTTQDKDLPLVQKAKELGVFTFTGSENDVLDRYYQAAQTVQAKEQDLIVRITGDCPLINPEIIDQVILHHKEQGVDYTSNVHPPTFPDGMDVEVFTMKTLTKAWNEATLPSEREHVTPYIWKNQFFSKANLTSPQNYSNLRITVDQAEDLEFIRKIIQTLGNNPTFQQIDDAIKNSSLLPTNENFKRNEGYEKSLVQESQVQEPLAQKPTHLIQTFTTSTQWLKRAKKLIPSASQTYSKSYKYFCEGAAPAFLEKGHGACVWDVDGNKYIDFILGLGPVTIGYNNQEINQAVIEQLHKGVTFSQPTTLEVELAQKLTQIIPAAEMVKFVKNGSDATTAAIRLARAHTKKDIIACSGYHGYHDWYIGTTTNNLGVPNAVKELTKKFTYNDIQSLKKIFDDNPGNVAAVILEPCQGTGPEDDFLEKVKQLTHQHGAVLIFDEVVSGFRMGLAGAQGHYGVTPDLAAFGKGMANGFSLSAVVGKKEIMELIDDGAFISTTFGGETLPLVAALKTIEILERPESFKHILHLGDLWLLEMQKLIERKNLQQHINYYGLSPHCGITFNKIKNLEPEDLLSVYQQTLIEHGILSLGVNNFSLAHTEQDVYAFIVAADKALDKVAIAIEQNSVTSLLRGEKFRSIFARR